MNKPFNIVGEHHFYEIIVALHLLLKFSQDKRDVDRLLL